MLLGENRGWSVAPPACVGTPFCASRPPRGTILSGPRTPSHDPSQAVGVDPRGELPAGPRHPLMWDTPFRVDLGASCRVSRTPLQHVVVSPHPDQEEPVAPAKLTSRKPAFARSRPPPIFTRKLAFAR